MANDASDDPLAKAAPRNREEELRAALATRSRGLTLVSTIDNANPGLPERSSCFAAALDILRAGGCPVPVRFADVNGKRKKWPAIKWGRFKTARPTLADLEQWQPKFEATNGGVGFIVRAGQIVIDADDAATVAWLQQMGLCPTVLTKRGAHYFLRGDFQGARTLPAPFKGEVRGAGTFVILPPTRGYRWANGQIAWAQIWAEAASFPERLTESLHTSERLPPAAAAGGSLELVGYARLLQGQGLVVNRTTGSAYCPFHADDVPSLSLYRPRRLRGRWAWRCHAECQGSGTHHGGLLEDLARLLGQPAHTECWAAIRQDVMTAGLPQDARAAALAAVTIAEERDLSPLRTVRLTYREIGPKSGLEEVSATTRALSHSGRRIKRALLALNASCLVSVKIGRGDHQMGGRRPTVISFRKLCRAARHENKTPIASNRLQLTGSPQTPNPVRCSNAGSLPTSQSIVALGADLVPIGYPSCNLSVQDQDWTASLGMLDPKLRESIESGPATRTRRYEP